MPNKIIISKHPIHIKNIHITPSNLIYYKYIIVREINGEYYFYDFAETEEKANIISSWYENAYAIEMQYAIGEEKV